MLKQKERKSQKKISAKKGLKAGRKSQEDQTFKLSYKGDEK